MAQTIKLDIVSDVTCPWCVIGYKHIEKAIAELGLKDKVEIEWQPFELNPEMPDEGENLIDHLARKYGSTQEKSMETFTDITRMGAEHGFRFDYYDEMKIVSTLDAHILLDHAKSIGRQKELMLRLTQAYFGERKDISDRVVLLKELNKAGLNGRDLVMKLGNEPLRRDIREQQAYWRQSGVTRLPTVVFNHTRALSGLQSVETYKRELKRLLPGNL